MWQTYLYIAICKVLFIPVERQLLWLTIFDSLVPAGFPSPAEDHLGVKLNLNQMLPPHPASTYLVRVMGNSMTGVESCIQDGSLLAVDCQLEAHPDDVVIVVIEGQFTVKRLIKRGPEAWFLVPDNPNLPEMQITEPDLFTVLGVVTHVLTETRRTLLVLLATTFKELAAPVREFWGELLKLGEEMGLVSKEGSLAKDRRKGWAP
ncbi:hypothetical protein GCM10027346_02910 [Hymenobacter seoulensis]